MLMQSGSFPVVFEHIPNQTVQDVNNGYTNIGGGGEKPGNIPMPEPEGLMGSPRRENIRSLRRDRQDLSLHGHLIDEAQYCV